MRKGEKIILGAMLVSVIILITVKVIKHDPDAGEDPGIPYYSTASAEIEKSAAKTMHLFSCKKCHSLWGTRDFTQSVPAPSLDGMGMFRTEEWLYAYFSSENPQEMLPSRLKEEYRMPALVEATEQERRDLAKYIASLKVEPWYLEETKKARYEKLTGKEYKPDEPEI